jgi:hypothetical protein
MDHRITESASASSGHPTADDAASNWRPIASAPRDGTRILSFGPAIEPDDETHAVIFWSTHKKCWILADDSEYPEWIGVTHWMPLTEPSEDRPIT